MSLNPAFIARPKKRSFGGAGSVEESGSGATPTVGEFNVA